MIKLFFRNKLVEIANMIYDHRVELTSAGITVLVVIALNLGFYIIGIIIAEPFYQFTAIKFDILLHSKSWVDVSTARLFASSITIISIYALYYVSKALASFGAWIVSNTKLAMNGTKVPANWR